MTASRCAAARSTRASHSSVLHSSRLMRETWNCTLISLLLSRGSYGGDTEKYHAASTRSSPVEAAASSGLSSSPELCCPRDRGSFRRPAHRRHNPGHCGLHPGHCGLLERAFQRASFERNDLGRGGARCGSRSWQRVPWEVISAGGWPRLDMMWAFMARGAHGDAIRRDGLRIESALGHLHLKNANVTDDPKQVGL